MRSFIESCILAFAGFRGKQHFNFTDLQIQIRNSAYSDCTDVIKTHERLEAVNETINALNLVPKGFGK